MSCINLSRNTRVFISTVNTGWTATNTWEIPVQDNYDFGQDWATTDVGLNESGETPTRGSKRFNDSLEPANWSLTTYINPIDVGGDTHVVDKILWHSLVSNATPDWDNTSTSSSAYGDVTSFKVDFTNSGVNVLQKFYIYFQVDNAFAVLDGCMVDSVEVPFSIEELGMTNWSGNGENLTWLSAAPAFIAANDYTAIPTISGSNYITNKLSTATLVSDISGGSKTYEVPFTGGSITISNNTTYLTPNTLGSVDKPVASFTGGLDVTGSIEAYLRTIDTKFGTYDFLQDILADTDSITNSVDTTIVLGPAAGTRVVISLPTAQFAGPSTSPDDVVSCTLEFKGIPSDQCLVAGDEIDFEFFYVA